MDREDALSLVAPYLSAISDTKSVDEKIALGKELVNKIYDGKETQATPNYTVRYEDRKDLSQLQARISTLSEKFTKNLQETCPKVDFVQLVFMRIEELSNLLVNSLQHKADGMTISLQKAVLLEYVYFLETALDLNSQFEKEEIQTLKELLK